MKLTKSEAESIKILLKRLRISTEVNWTSGMLKDWVEHANKMETTILTVIPTIKAIIENGEIE